MPVVASAPGGRPPGGRAGSSRIARPAAAGQGVGGIAIGPPVGIDGEIHGKLTDCRKLVARGQGAGSDTRSHLIDELAVHRDAGMKIESEGEAAVLKIPSHAH